MEFERSFLPAEGPAGLMRFSQFIAYLLAKVTEFEPNYSDIVRGRHSNMTISIQIRPKETFYRPIKWSIISPVTFRR